MKGKEARIAIKAYGLGQENGRVTAAVVMMGAFLTFALLILINPLGPSTAFVEDYRVGLMGAAIFYALGTLVPTLLYIVASLSHANRTFVNDLAHGETLGLYDSDTPKLG